MHTPNRDGKKKERETEKCCYTFYGFRIKWSVAAAVHF